MTRFFTSDLHFSHDMIMFYTDRHELWKTAEDMYQSLVHNWNKVVQPGDEVFIVGDFAFKNHASWLGRLAGSKYLIKGSHDKMGDDVLRQFAIKPCTEMVVPLTETRKVLLHHTVLRTWERGHYGAVAHLFGHSHGRTTTFNMSRDIGVDCPDASYAPFRDSYLADWFNTRELQMKADGRIVVDERGRTLYRQDDTAYLLDLLQAEREKNAGSTGISNALENT